MEEKVLAGARDGERKGDVNMKVNKKAPDVSDRCFNQNQPFINQEILMCT
jgi:hypothetical protein